MQINITKHFKTILLTFIVSITLTQSGFTQSTSSNDKLSADIDEIFKPYINAPGCAVAVVKEDQVLYQKTFGKSNLAYDIPVDQTTVFELGAMTMHFTASCILALEDKGLLQLDDPIQKHLVDFPKFKEGKVTIRHLLHHSAGIRDYIALMEKKDISYHSDFNDADAYKLLKKQKSLSITPGSDYRYSNSNYFLLGEIVRKVSGKTLNEFAQTALFKPLGMNNTFYFESSDLVIKNQAIAYSKKEGEDFMVSHRYNFSATGDGRLYSCLEDMVKWMKHIINGQFGNQTFKDRIGKVGKLNNGTEMSYAYGLEHGTANGIEILGHNGYWSGFTGMLLMYPQENTVIFTITNNGSENATAKVIPVEELIFEKQIAEFKAKEKGETKPELKQQSAFKMDSNKLSSYSGDYFNYSTGYRSKFYMRNDTLMFKNYDDEDRGLLPIGEDKFEVIDPLKFKIHFKKEDNKDKMFFQYGERPPYVYEKFTPTEATPNELKKYTGSFYSNELEVSYNVHSEKNEIIISLDDKEIGRYNYVMEGVFNSAHDGYVRYYSDSSNKIEKFTLSDYWFGTISFLKKDNEEQVVK